MSKVLLIDIGGTNLRYAYSDGDLSSLNDTNKIKLSCIKGFNDILKDYKKTIDKDHFAISSDNYEVIQIHKNLDVYLESQ